jgi:hypothetical protein
MSKAIAILDRLTTDPTLSGENTIEILSALDTVHLLVHILPKAQASSTVRLLYLRATEPQATSKKKLSIL